MSSDRRRGDDGRPVPPVADAALQGPKLAGEEHPGLFPATVEELLRGPMRLGLQHAIRGQLVSNGSCRASVVLWRARWVGRTSPARHAPGSQEPVEVGVTFRGWTVPATRWLDGNLVQRERVHRTEHRAQPVLRRNGNRVRRQQARARRLRRMVALPNTAAVARLLRQLERRLEDGTGAPPSRGGPAPRLPARPPGGRTRPSGERRRRSSARPRPGRSDRAWTV